jgi:phosphoribosyl-AMP cyclohydrolase / phosphoribosyl-ATP pyrophosphohydrolase
VSDPAPTAPAPTGSTGSTAEHTTADRPAGVPADVRLGRPIPFSEEELATVAFNADGLVAAIVQDASDGTVLMFAWMNAESLELTLETGRSCFWSRSRQELWWKGETSGERQYVRRVQYDCDGDVLLLTVDQEGGGACHTGHRSCFFRAFGEPTEGR